MGLLMASARKKAGKKSAGRKAKAAPKKSGRPSKFTMKAAGIICSRLADGDNLKAICREDSSLPHEATVRAWALDDREGFYALYARARELGALAIADRLRDEARKPCEDNVAVQQQRLIIDTDKWYLAKLFRKQFGERVEVAGDKDAPVVVLSNEERARQLALLVATAAARRETGGGPSPNGNGHERPKAATNGHEEGD
jgi:hypothetical protein